jgi:hypothetical protein
LNQLSDHIPFQEFGNVPSTSTKINNFFEPPLDVLQIDSISFSTVGSNVLGSREALSPIAHQEPVHHPFCYFIFQIVGFPAIRMSCSAIPLQFLDMAIENYLVLTTARFHATCSRKWQTGASNG